MYTRAAGQPRPSDRNDVFYKRHRQTKAGTGVGEDALVEFVGTTLLVSPPLFCMLDIEVIGMVSQIVGAAGGVCSLAAQETSSSAAGGSASIAVAMIGAAGGVCSLAAQETSSSAAGGSASIVGAMIGAAGGACCSGSLAAEGASAPVVEGVCFSCSICIEGRTETFRRIARCHVLYVR